MARAPRIDGRTPTQPLRDAEGAPSAGKAGGVNPSAIDPALARYVTEGGRAERAFPVAAGARGTALRPEQKAAMEALILSLSTDVAPLVYGRKTR